VALPVHGRPVSSMGVDFRDYDNDGLPDITVTALTGETFPLFHNEGSGTFQDVTYPSGVGGASVRRSGWANAFVDLDNDGWKDLFTANSHVDDQVDRFEASTYRQANSVFRNNQGKFEDGSRGVGAALATATAAHRGGALADFDNDGRIDVATSALGDIPELWENLGPAGHWLRFELEGTRSNRDGIGARVQIGKTQSNVMTTAVGYASSSKQGVHFGLGKATSVETVTIHWPSGATQTLTNVKADKVVKVKEESH
jgi:hypothetical protein